MNEDRRPKTEDQRHVLSYFRSSFFFRRSSFVLLLVAFLTLAFIYNTAVPLGEGPDEPGHFAYVLFLAREGRLPVQQAGAKSDVPGEGHQPPLAYVLALPTVAWLPAAEQQLNLTANPDFVWSGGHSAAAFSRGSQEYWPWHSRVLAWHLARSISALCGALTLFCTWSIARRLGSDTPTALLAAALVAFNPQFLFVSSLVTNDALLTALSVAALLVAVGGKQDTGYGIQDAGGVKRRRGDKAIRQPVSRLASSTSLGLLIGLALLTKQSAVILLALVPLAAWRRYAGHWARVFVWMLLSLSVVALVAGWWYWRNIRLYGDALGLAAFQETFLTQSWDWRDPKAWGGALVQLHESFWGRFGWMSISLPDWIYWTLGLVELVALAGLMYRTSGVWRAASNNGRELQIVRPASLALLLVLPALAFAWTVSFALTAGLVAWQGRFLFPALPAIAVLLAQGLRGRDRRQEIGETRQVHTLASRVSRLASRSSCLVLFALAVWLPFGIIAPTYVWHTLPAAQAIQQIEQPLQLRFAESWKRGVELRGWGVTGDAQPGNTLTVTLTWHALEQIPRNWTVFIHLIDANGEIVAEDNTEPVGGQLPMRQWTADDWVRDQHTLVLPPTLQPGTYTLRAGLYDPNRRHEPMQTVWNAQGDSVDPEVVLGSVEALKR